MFKVLEEHYAKIRNPEKMKYLNKPDKDGYIKIVRESKIESRKLRIDEFLIQVLSESEDKAYVVAYCHGLFEDDPDYISPDRFHFYVLKKHGNEKGECEFEIIDSFEEPDDIGIRWAVNRFEWFLEYGFVKMIVKNVDTWEYKNQRIYYDRALYEKKKADRALDD